MPHHRRLAPSSDASTPAPGHRPGSTRIALSAALAAALIALGCEPSAPNGPAPVAPAVGPRDGLAELAPGVAFEIGATAVDVATLERAADALAIVRPRDARSALLRRVLVDQVLARIAIARHHGAARAAALVEAEAFADRLRAGERFDAGSAEHPVAFAGVVDALDPWVWLAVKDARAGDVLGPIETTAGTFAVVAVKVPFDPAGPFEQRVELGGATFVFAPPPLPLPQEALAGVPARFAERRWRDLVPTSILLALDLEDSEAP